MNLRYLYKESNNCKIVDRYVENCNLGMFSVYTEADGNKKCKTMKSNTGRKEGHVCNVTCNLAFQKKSHLHKISNEKRNNINAKV